VAAKTLPPPRDRLAREAVSRGGHRDGVLVRADGREYEAPFRPVEMRGRSGRGDTCIGSYLSRRLDHDAPAATLWAAAVTSLKLEAEGPVRRTVADAMTRCRELER